MKRIVLAALAVVLLAIAGAPYLTAQQQDLRADYARAMDLRDRIQDKVLNELFTPTWVEGGNPALWYRRSVTGGSEFMLVDVPAATKAPAFDHARLATALSSVAKAKYTATTLPFTTFTFVDARRAIEFGIGGAAPGGGRAGGAPAGPRYRCTLTDYQCTIAPAAPQQGGGGGQGRGGGAAGGNAPPAERVSPDRTTEAFIQNYNVYVRPAGRPQEARALGTDGSEGDAYTLTSIVWSPDSKKIAAYRVKPGYTRLVTYVESSPTDQVQPKASTRAYPKPGDALDLQQPVIFNLEAKQQFVADRSIFPNAYAQSPLLWRTDSRGVSFEYNQRGHQAFKVIEIDAATGRPRAVVDEQAKTFFSYYGKKYRFDVNDGREVIWMSERDGWNHLYLYDGTTGQVKNQITKGAWVVRGVERVDTAKRQVYFRASGMHASKDPYFFHIFRVNFDGTGLTPLTDGDGSHAVTFSQDLAYYVDTYSRVDAAPISVMRRSNDAQVVMELERANIQPLLATGWRTPEVFTAMGRDGKTDIWGIIIRPTNFDATKTYPVIEYIYAGPHDSFVPKTFSTQLALQAQAELGFIVVQIDGMGTSNRSKAFHDVAWKNLKDAGFPDRILWHRAVAAKYRYYDATRVGIYGHSAGGQNALGALLFHPDFYSVAVSSCGCHDNRMDKISWNEQWMGWPIGPEYAACSNVDNAKNLRGRVLLSVGELDTNVDPSSTLQVVAALIKANKDFDFLVLPGQGHSAGGAYGERKRFDFFVRHLRGANPPAWNMTDLPASPGGGDALADLHDALHLETPGDPLEADPFWRFRLR